MRRRGLAVLAYVAVVGEAPRERLAQLLWPAGSGRSNLRVELHRLNAAVGSVLFEPAADPLRLPSWVGTDVAGVGGQLLEGLEGISEPFDDWIDARRSARDRGALARDGMAELARSLAPSLRPPFLLLVRAKPGVDLSGFVRELGDALRLPVFESGESNGKALHVVNLPYPDQLARTVLADRHGSWVVRVPAYGEDPQTVLELRNGYDPGRLRYVDLPPVSWQDSREGLLAVLPFGAAAEAYLWSGGNEGILRELGRMRWQRGEDGRYAVPQRVRAAYQIELRHASMRARLALERLAVHPERLSSGLIDVFDARPAIDELERRGWLVYDGAWRFRDVEARTVLYGFLQAGRRATYHRAAARQMALEGRPWARAYHALAAGDPVDWLDDRSQEGVTRLAVRAWLGLPTPGPEPALSWLSPGRELALLEAGREGRGLSGTGARWTFVGLPGGPVSEVAFELPGGASLLHVTGRAAVASPLGVGLDGHATPLEFEVAGLRVVFVKRLERPVLCASGVVLLPLGETIDRWVALPPASRLRVVCKAEAAVLELEMTVHEVADAGGGGPGNRACSTVTAVEVAWPVFASTTAASSC